LPEQVRADLALLEVGNKDALWTPCQEPLFLRRCSGSFRKILALEGQNVEGIELHLVIMPAGVQAVVDSNRCRPSRSLAADADMRHADQGVREAVAIKDLAAPLPKSQIGEARGRFSAGVFAENSL
jgi:hypothetical protein